MIDDDTLERWDRVLVDRGSLPWYIWLSFFLSFLTFYYYCFFFFYSFSFSYYDAISFARKLFSRNLIAVGDERPDQKQIRASQRDKHTDRLYIYIYTYIYIERRSERAKLSVYIIPPTERGRSQVSWEELCCRGSRSCQKGEGEKSKITRSRKKRVAVTKTQEGTQKKNER